MWNHLKQQFPAIVVTVALVIGAVAYAMHAVVVRQDAVVASLQRQDEQLRAQADANQRELATTTQLIKDAIAHRPTNGGGLFADTSENPAARREQISQLAEAVAKKIEPSLPTPQSPEEAARLQDEQVTRVADRLENNLRPMLAREKADAEQRVRQAQDRADGLRRQLAETQAAAQDALKLTNEVSAMYYDSFRDQGVLVRLLSLPAELVTDTAKGNLVTSRDRAKVQKEISAKINELDQRLNRISTAGVTRS